MQNANVHARWDLLGQLVKQSSQTLVCSFLSAVPLLSFVSILQRQCKTMLHANLIPVHVVTLKVCLKTIGQVTYMLS